MGGEKASLGLGQPVPFADICLARRLEMAVAFRGIHYAQAYAMLHPESRATHEMIGSGAVIFISPQSPVNKASGLGLNGPVSQSEFQAAEDVFLRHGATPVFSTSPMADHSLFRLLSKNGYGVSMFLNLLWRTIRPGYQPEPLPVGMRVTRAAPGDGQQWLEITAKGFDEVEQPSPETYEILGPNFYAPESACFLAWLDGQLAAGGGMYLHDHVVELGGTSTVPAFRRKGAQRALIGARLAAAHDLGCDLALILTEPGNDSQRNAQRAGFSVAYTQTFWRKDPYPE